MAKQVGRYQIQQRVGQGAMANVYRAYDPGIDRVIAIKVLKREYCRDADCAARFLREAKAAGALNHPNIVTIYDVGEIEGYPYIAMELLDGEPLDKAAQRIGQFPIADVLEIGSQLTDALAYAHAQGVVHRDIKPSNIMLGGDGRSIKILDFGIAHVGEAASDQLKTQVGQVLGTPRYMSPEQALGREIDGRSDLFSLGVVLYELIAGRPAFNGSSAATLALQITQQDPPPIDTPACPRGLKFIVGKLLAKRPEKRFASGKHLHHALVREKQAFAAASLETTRRHLPLPLRLMVQTAAITAIALGVATGVVLTRQEADLRQMAIAAGASVATFVADNAAVEAANNDALPEDRRDWRALQDFVQRTAANPNITQLMIVDSGGVIRAASDRSMIGARYLPASRHEPVGGDGVTTVASARASTGAESLRFARQIAYYGRPLGHVDVSLRKGELQTIADRSLAMLSALAILTLCVVAALSFAAARVFVDPIQRLKSALRDAAAGDLDFRISHRRADEFGDLFDAFNTLAAAMQERLERTTAKAAAPPHFIAKTDVTHVQKAANA